MRIGHGFDVHKFGGRGPLVIGGVNIPYSKGLIAHSDGDVMLHAVIDALIGAASLGDIGRLFPDNNPCFRNISSRKLLRIVWKMVVLKGYSLGNLDISLVIQSPKVAPYISDMFSNIMHDLECNIDAINIKSTTTEGLGYIGRGEGIACEAVVLLLKCILY